jgi:hypothetical protein
MNTTPSVVTEEMLTEFFTDRDYGEAVQKACADVLRAHPERWNERYKVLMDALNASREHRTVTEMGNKPFAT